MIWRWSLNLSVSSLKGYDSLYSLYIFDLFETIQFVGYPFLLLLAFFLISFSFFFWYPLHHPPVAVAVKSQGGGKFTRLFLCKSNPEHTCLSILIILPINLFSLVCFSLLVWYIIFIIIIIIIIYFLLLVWYRIRHQAKADSRNNCVAWSAWTRN